MKKVSFALIALLCGFTAFSQQPIVLKPKIQEVVVYLSGAEIQFVESVSLKKGTNVVHFKGLSPALEQNSVQVVVGSTVDVVSVSTETQTLNAQDINPRVKALTDTTALLADNIALVNNQIDAYQVEKKMLEQNQHLGGAQAAVSLVELTKAADFFRERTLKINQALFGLTKTQSKLTQLLQQKTNELTAESQKTNPLRYTVVVTVNSKTDQAVEFRLRHLVNDCGWEASYDIVAPEIGKPVTLKYKADIYNETHIDWRDVKLSLSTGDISQNATRPYLTTWILNYTSQANEGTLNATAQNLSQDKSVASAETEERTVSELNTSFVLDQHHTIAANGQPYHITLQDESLQASFEYITLPKLEMSAFLLAKVTGWEKLNLMDGTAKVYFGNAYVGESNINTRLIGDTLELSLGRDNQIVVSRSKVEDTGNTPSIGGKRSESFVYEIQLRNNRKVPVSIRVQDQIPVSQEKDITVETSELSGANLNAPSGRLQWVKTLGSGETSKFKIAFTVRYPKNKTVSIRKSRTVRSPRYRH
ncbi:DUF4139 domain-containing protein [Chryseolinea lacunae]|uniref:DUF4139 domain-containing protein n=1 Tax=Chryseolinea lacunae TaxID=2801331 RepID=A0ABS1L0I3_9BACT|nr:DUF4139 domain-containing protein [Chryseolinea lacunae]MBL0744427.1 DUF4139 domain-containing protein [Chryseolinea lacunae]